eukprot:3471015-Prymnesium_polylepis.1
MELRGASSRIVGPRVPKRERLKREREDRTGPADDVRFSSSSSLRSRKASTAPWTTRRHSNCCRASRAG